MAASEEGRGGQNKKFHIHVAGLPSRITPDEIWTYFGSFGDVQAVRTIPSHSPGKVKGYCLLAMADSKSYARVLAYKDHRLFGRSILCVPHQSGNQLMRHNRLTNKRRVVIAGVPVQQNPAELREFLQLTGGPVEALYQEKISAQEYWKTIDLTQLASEFERRFGDTSDLEAVIDPSQKIYSAIFESEHTAALLIKKRFLRNSKGPLVCIFESIEKAAGRKNAGQKRQSTTPSQKGLSSFSDRVRCEKKFANFCSNRANNSDDHIQMKPTQRSYHLKKRELTNLAKCGCSSNHCNATRVARSIIEPELHNIRLNLSASPKHLDAGI